MMKLLSKRRRDSYNKTRDEAPEPSEFDKAKEEYQKIYKGCEDDTFSAKLHYVSGATSLFKNTKLNTVLWLLTCFKLKYRAGTYWKEKHDCDLSIDFTRVTYIEVSKENKRDQDN